MRYNFTRAELKTKKASEFKEGDVIKTGIYYIYIKYGQYDRPSLCSYHKEKTLNLADVLRGVTDHIILIIFLVTNL